MKPTGYLVTHPAWTEPNFEVKDITDDQRNQGFSSVALYTLEEAFSDVREFLAGPGKEVGDIVNDAGWDVSEAMIECLLELLHRRKQNMFPTHSHADGGLYEFLGHGEMKHPVTGNWEPAVAYRGLNGVRCFTTLKRYRERFTRLKEALPLEKLLLAVEGELAGNPQRITLATGLVKRMVDKILDKDETRSSAISHEE